MRALTARLGVGGSIPGKIFLDYRRSDAEAWADRVYERLMAQFPLGDVFMVIDGYIPLGLPGRVARQPGGEMRRDATHRPHVSPSSKHAPAQTSATICVSRSAVDLLRMILAYCLGERGLRSVAAAWAASIGLADISAAWALAGASDWPCAGLIGAEGLSPPTDSHHMLARRRMT
jgi:hypothetical protein